MGQETSWQCVCSKRVYIVNIMWLWVGPSESEAFEHTYVCLFVVRGLLKATNFTKLVGVKKTTNFIVDWREKQHTINSHHLENFTSITVIITALFILYLLVASTLFSCYHAAHLFFVTGIQGPPVRRLPRWDWRASGEKGRCLFFKVCKLISYRWLQNDIQ